MTLDLDMFKVNVLAVIHLFTTLISPFILYFKLDMLSSCKIRHVSSAYSLRAELVELLMSLIYIVYKEQRTKNRALRNTAFDVPVVRLSMI